jgi:hypothetical protein
MRAFACVCLSVPRTSCMMCPDLCACLCFWASDAFELCSFFWFSVAGVGMHTSMFFSKKKVRVRGGSVVLIISPQLS